MFSALVMCVLGAVFYCYEYYLRVAPSVMIPDLMLAYNLSNAGIGVLVAYYYFAYVPLQILVGVMIDLWGPRKILTIACFLCAFGTYLFAGTNIFWLAASGRFFVGFGSAFAYVGVLKIASLWLPKRYFAMVAGLCTTLGMLGAISGKIIMAKLVAITGWKQTLYSSAFVGLPLTIALWIFIRDKSNKYIMQKSRASHAKDMSLGKELLIIIKDSQLWINGIIGGLMFLPLTAFAELWAESFLKTAGLSINSAAIGASLVFCGYGIGGPIWGKLSDTVQSRRLLLIIGSILSSIVAGYFIFYTPTNYIILYVFLFVCGLFASAQVLVFAVCHDICKPELSATTISFTNFLVMIQGMINQPLIGKFLDFKQHGAAASISDYRFALLVLPLGLLLSAGLGFMLKESYQSH